MSWIRSISRYVKAGERVLLVKRVNVERSGIDLALKQVSADRKKLLEIKGHYAL